MRTYTGFRLALTLALVAVFFLPILAFGMGLWFLGAAESELENRGLMRFELHNATETEACITREGRTTVIRCGVGGSIIEHIVRSKALGATAGLFIFLLAYNLLRLALTVYIAPQRDEFVRSGYTPDCTKIALLTRVHRLLQVFGLIVVIPSLFGFFRILNVEAVIPTF